MSEYNNVVTVGKSRNKQATKKFGKKFKQRSKDLPVSNETDVPETTLSHKNNHQDNQTIWGMVTIGFVKNTKTYQMFVNQDGSLKSFTDINGKVQTYKRENVIRASLYSLGFNINHFRGYQIKQMIVRYNHNQSEAIETDVYIFPVCKDFKYKDMYRGEVLTVLDKNAKKVDLSAYGTSFFSEDNAKPEKKMTCDEILDQILAEGHL